MEDSILTSTKAVLGIASDYTAFDLDVLTHINAAFSTASQMGIPEDGMVVVTDDLALWSEIPDITDEIRSLLRTYVLLKVRMLFDPPGTSFLIEAMNKQIHEIEWRLSTYRETDPDYVFADEEEVI